MKLQSIQLSGFKSIRQADIRLDSLNVLIGANGAGKSNLVSFFEMLNYMMTGSLQNFIGIAGGANSLLHYGAKTTPQIRTTLDFETEKGSIRYVAGFSYSGADTLVFAEETATFFRPDQSRGPLIKAFGAGFKESILKDAVRAGDENETVKVIQWLLTNCRVFQFHDTSKTSHLRQNCDIENNRYLYSDAGNLVAFLYRLEHTQKPYYDRIVSAIKQIAPFFGGFVLEPSTLNSRYISLRWKERGSDYEFGPHQLSDGLLRAMALVTLLLQPEKSMPPVIIIDEPELGLHPYAIVLISSLIRQAARHTQVILATQSTRMLDEFDPEHVVVVNRKEGCSEFARLDAEGLKDWLAEYSVSELWEKNVLGGRPSR